MTTIATPQQARERYKVLPPLIQEIVFSVDTSEIIWKVGGDNHFDEDKISKLADAVSLVLLGFIHPEDIPQEIKSSLGIDLQLANDIYASLNKKLFTPVKGELEKIYSPSILPATTTEETLVEEIKKPEKVGVEISTTPPTPVLIKPIPVPAPLTTKLQGGPAPITLPVITETKKTPTPQTTPTPTITPIQPKTILEPATTVSGPVIIHQEKELQPLKPPSPTLRLAEEKSIFERVSQKLPAVPPPVARIEIGNLSPRAQKEFPPSRIVNYSETRTPLSEIKKAAVPIPPSTIQDKSIPQPTKPISTPPNPPLP